LPLVGEQVSPLEAIRDARDAVRTLGALAAAGALTSRALHDATIELLVVTTNTLAVLEASTPRSIQNEAYKAAPNDDFWRATTLRNMRVSGRRLLERDAA
jgi:hypothetical protein